MAKSCNFDKINANLVKAGLQPITRNNILFYYGPIKGWVSYTMLASQMMSPELYHNFRLFRIFGIPQYISLTNACLINALAGTALYLYSRPHLAKAPPKDRALFSAFGSAIFNLGSMLTWALGHTVAPESPTLRFIMGVGGAVGVLYVGKRYADYLDGQAESVKQ